MTNPETQKSCEEIAQCIVACELASRVPMGKTLRETEDYKIIRDNLLLKITEALLSERQIAEKLREQLPEGMKDCTIIFKQCSLGHGWLTAKNWIQHECLTCERDKLIEENDRLKKALGVDHTVWCASLQERYDALKDERDGLMERVSWLVEALDEIGKHSSGWGDKARKALATIPYHYLEISKAKDRCVAVCIALDKSVKWELADEIKSEIKEALTILQSKQEESK